MRNPLVPTSPAVAAQMAGLLGPRTRVLDMGTGDGRLLRSYLSVFPETSCALGMDIAALPSDSPGATFEQGDVLELSLSPGLDGILANPPYERVAHMTPERRQLLRETFLSATGQFDLWFVFVEKALQLLGTGGRGVFLIPEGLATRPAAAGLRALLDERTSWRLQAPGAEPFAVQAGVQAEILVFDRKNATLQTSSPEDLVSEQRPVTVPQVSVGAATGANTVFIRRAHDPWLNEIEPAFLLPVFRGRDASTASSREGDETDLSRMAVWPYEVRSGDVRPIVPVKGSGLERFLEHHSEELNARSRRPGPHYIQCPPPSVIGERVVVPEVYSAFRPTVVRDRHLVLNSAFIVIPAPGDNAEQLAEHLRTRKALDAVRRHSRRLSSDYWRTTATGLAQALADLTE